MGKVYCKFCSHLYVTGSNYPGDGGGIYKCKHGPACADTWYGPGTPQEVDPKEQNKNNDCPFFDSKISTGLDAGR